jgi:hypothetical protein
VARLGAPLELANPVPDRAFPNPSRRLLKHYGGDQKHAHVQQQVEQVEMLYQIVRVAENRAP